MLPDASFNKEFNITGLKEYVLSMPHEICHFSLIKSEDEEDEAATDAGSSEDEEDKEDEETNEERKWRQLKAAILHFAKKK